MSYGPQEENLHEFRGSGPDGGQMAALLDIRVEEYEVGHAPAERCGFGAMVKSSRRARLGNPVQAPVVVAHQHLRERSTRIVEVATCPPEQ